MKTIASFILAFFVLAPGTSQFYAEKPMNVYQDIYDHTVDNNGGHPLLRIGKYYENPYYNSVGHPYLFEDQFYDGSATYRDEHFNGLRLKYDLFHQHLIINHADPKDPLQNLLEMEFISAFTVNGLQFEKVDINGQSGLFCQVVASEPSLGCYYHWFKNRSESHDGKYRVYVFGESKLRRYIYVKDKLIKYRNNKSFLKCFPDAIQKEVKSYLKNNHIKVQQADDAMMKEIIHFCQTQLNDLNQ